MTTTPSGEGWTPGPWEVRLDPCHYHTASSVHEAGVDFPSIAEVGGSTVEMQEANARLIAAAPALYAACKAMLAEMTINQAPGTLPVMQQAEAALTLATQGAKAAGGGE